MSGYVFYLVLLIPAGFMCFRLVSGSSSADMLLHGSGEWSARLMILTLAITPLRQLLPEARWVSWLRARRRQLGVAAFSYALLHTLFYVIDMASLELMLAELGASSIWTGWLAFALFTALAITSNEIAVRRLGRQWQSLHRLVYVAAIATLVHWIFIHNNAAAAWVHFAPLIILEMLRVKKILVR